MGVIIVRKIVCRTCGVLSVDYTDVPAVKAHIEQNHTHELIEVYTGEVVDG